MSISQEMELEWLKIRDLFCGRNGTRCDVRRAMELALSCAHPEAKWLFSVCGLATSRDEAREMLLALEEEDARALCFAWMLSDENEADQNEQMWRLEKAATLGCALALAELAGQRYSEDKFLLASRGAQLGERDAFSQLGIAHHFGYGCQQNLELAKHWHLRAAQLGSVHGMGGSCCFFLVVSLF
jgi:hypothetical protein